MKHLAGLLVVLGAFNSEAADTTVRPALVYEKIFGGTGTDLGTSVAVDADGYVYITGTTTSVDFPVRNGFQARIGGTPLRVSTNNGKAWVSPAIPAPVFAVAGSPKQAGVLFAGTASGIFKSTDAGNTWNALKSGPAYQVNSIIVDPNDPAVIYGGGSEGIFKSRDGGLTWQQNNLQGPSNVIVLVSSPLRSSTLFAGIDLGGIPSTPTVYRSTDAGATWALLLNSPIGAFALACDPTNPDVMYAGVSKGGFSSSATSTAVYKTSDSGDTWTKLADLPLAISTLNLVASPAAVYAATKKGVVVSRDGGITWNATSVTDVADAVAVDPNNPQVVFASAGGIFASTDGGTNWTSVLPVRQYVQSISVVPSTPSSVFVGASPGQNIFVSKWSKDGTQLLYSTYLGGSFADYSKGIAVDSHGNAYVTGYTFSTDFPVTATAFQSKNAGPYNAFLAKIGADGSTLEYSTYVGGSSGDAAEAIAVDRTGNAYLTGYTVSSDFPVTNAVQPKLRQGCSTAPPPGLMSRANLGDAFVVKISPATSVLSYSTYLGGTCADEGLGIAVDPSGYAYVVGATTSPDFPVTKGALLESYRGSANTGFLTKLTPQGGLANATFLGGPGSDVASAVTLGDEGSIYVAGSTLGFDKILFGGSGGYVIIGRFVDQLPVPGIPIINFGAAYVLKLDSTASTQKYLKYIGGNFGTGTTIAVDALGRAWVAGTTNPFGTLPSTPFPTVHPFQAETGTGFVTELSADGSVIPFSTLMDAATGLTLDTAGNVFVIGNTYRYISYKYFFQSALLDRIDSAVPSAMTVEEPQRLVPKVGSTFPLPGVASSEIVVLTGTGLGPTQEVGAQLTEDGKVATSLAGTSVTFDDVPAPLLSVQSERIVCIVPFEIADRQVRNPVMQVRRNNSRSNAILLGSAESAVEVLAVANSDGTRNAADHPAAPGSVVTVYAAGFGQTIPPSVDGQLNGIGSLQVAGVGVNIGEQDAQILYAGPAPGLVAGITQINFRLPQLAPAIYTTYVGWGPRNTFGDYNATPVYVGE